MRAPLLAALAGVLALLGCASRQLREATPIGPESATPNSATGQDLATDKPNQVDHETVAPTSSNDKPSPFLADWENSPGGVLRFRAPPTILPGYEDPGPAQRVRKSHF